MGCILMMPPRGTICSVGNAWDCLMSRCGGMGMLDGVGAALTLAREYGHADGVKSGVEDRELPGGMGAGGDEDTQCGVSKENGSSIADYSGT